jgi:hypothetical protein
VESVVVEDSEGIKFKSIWFGLTKNNCGVYGHGFSKLFFPRLD